jgi:hypothetical protein
MRQELGFMRLVQWPKAKGACATYVMQKQTTNGVQTR